MPAKINLVSVEDYLREERQGELRHEYIAGVVYAMAGASEEHNIIAANLLAAVHSHLRGTPCKAFIVDMKVGLSAGAKSVFYYPDLIVTCDSRDTDRYAKRFPKVVIESGHAAGIRSCRPGADGGHTFPPRNRLDPGDTYRQDAATHPGIH